MNHLQNAIAKLQRVALDWDLDEGFQPAVYIAGITYEQAKQLEDNLRFKSSSEDVRTVDEFVDFTRGGYGVEEIELWHEWGDILISLYSNESGDWSVVAKNEESMDVVDGILEGTSKPGKTETEDFPPYDTGISGE